MAVAEAEAVASYSLGEALRRAREQRTSLSARALSRACGQSPGYVQKVETGAIVPSFAAVCRIARELDLHPQGIYWLVRMEGERP